MEIGNIQINNKVYSHNRICMSLTALHMSLMNVLFVGGSSSRSFVSSITKNPSRSV